MKVQFIKMDQMRYRIGSIKRYESFEREGMVENFGIYIYFSMVGQSGRIYHTFKTAKGRDDILTKLDEIFGV